MGGVSDHRHDATMDVLIMDECMKSFFLFLFLSCSIFFSASHAQGKNEANLTQKKPKTVYVTDALQLKLNSTADDKGKTLGSLQSGDALTLLENQGAYSKVRTQKGIEGWVTSFYLTERTPAQLKLKEAQDQLAKREASIRQLEEQLQAMSKQTNNPGLLMELKSKVVLLNQENVMMTNEKEQLRKQLVQAELALKHSAPEASKEATELMRFFDKLPFTFPPYAWLGIALVIGLTLGFVLGYNYYSNKLKKRFYGFRI